MPRNTTGGKSHKRSANHKKEVKREFITKTEGQEYGQIIKMLGNGRVSVLCFDGRERLGIIRGAMRKRIWINQEDIVLVGLREFQEEKVDILHKFSTSEIIRLKRMGHLPETLRVDEKEENAFDFTGIDGEIEEEENKLPQPTRDMPESETTEKSSSSCSTDLTKLLE